MPIPAVRTDNSAPLTSSAPCGSCGKLLPPQGRKQRFCSNRCKNGWHRRNRIRQAEHLSITAAAAELGISRHAVYRSIRSGRLQAIPVPTAGRPRVEVTRGELERYRAGRPIRQRKLSPEEVDAEIRRAVGQMVAKVRELFSLPIKESKTPQIPHPQKSTRYNDSKTSRLP